MVQLTLDGGKAEAKCTCVKVGKNIRGLKIHQARSQCGIVTPQTTEKNRSRFVKNLKFTKELLGEERSGTLHFGKTHTPTH